MIVHVVFFKLRPEHRDAGPELVRRLRAMAGRIEGLERLETGVDIARSERAWDVALVTYFADREALAAYRTHPVHQEVLAYVRTVTATSAVVDFEA